MVYLIAGIILFLITAADIVYTILSSNGAGYLSKYTMRFIAYIFQFLARRLKSRKILKFAGVTILSSMIILWILLLWVSVFLILLSDTGSVLSSSDLTPAGVVEKFYFSGYILSTLGNGDFKPEIGFWQIMSTIFTFSGFVFLTTAITYFVRIIGAVTQKRSLALAVFDLGGSSEQIASTIKNLHQNSQLMSEITNLKNLFNQHTLNHTSFPISHYFFSQKKERSVSCAAAELHKALKILRADEENDKALFVQIEILQRAFDTYLEMLAKRFLGNLSDNQFKGKEQVKADENRTKTIRTLLISDVWLET